MASTDSRHKNGKRIYRWVISLLVTGLAFYFIIRQVRLEDLKTAFSTLKGQTWQVLGLLLLIYIVGQLLRALSIKLILGDNFDFATAYFSMNAGYLLNNFLPFRLGEIGRALLLTGEGRNKAPFYKVFASVVTERILDIFISASLFLLTLSLAATSQSLKLMAWIAWFLMLTLMVVMMILSRHKLAFYRWYGKIFGKRQFWMSKVLPKLASFLEGFEKLAEPKQLAAILGALALSWATSMGEISLMHKVLLPDPQWWWPAFLISASAFAAALPSAPGGLGVFEAAMVSAHLLLGVNQASALAIAFILHVYQFVVSSLLGLVGLERLGENISSITLKSSQRQKSEANRS